MYQVIYFFLFALIIVTALGVFICLGHACYKDLKETPLNKMLKKMTWYMATLALGIALIFTGQYFLHDNEYVQNLHRSWARFEGKIVFEPTGNISLEEFIELFEIEDTRGN